MGLIFYFSSQNAELSDETSGRAVGLFRKLFFPDWETLPQDEYLYQMHALTFFVRKLAHFTEYLILGILLSAVLMTFRKTWKFRFLTAVGAGILYALSDEFHQMFVAGRAMMFFDVLTDSAGVFFGTVLILGLSAAVMLSRREEQDPGAGGSA